MSLDGEYEYDDDEMPHDGSDIPLGGTTFEPSPSSGFHPHSSAGHARSSSQKQLSPHGLPHSVQNVHSQNHSMQSRRLRYSPYYAFEHDWQRGTSGSWYEQTNTQILTLIESQKKLMSMFETFSDRIGDIEKTVSSLKSDSSSSSPSSEEKKRISPQLSVSYFCTCTYSLQALHYKTASFFIILWPQGSPYATCRFKSQSASNRLSDMHNTMLRH